MLFIKDVFIDFVAMFIYCLPFPQVDGQASMFQATADVGQVTDVLHLNEEDVDVSLESAPSGERRKRSQNNPLTSPVASITLTELEEIRSNFSSITL